MNLGNTQDTESKTGDDNQSMLVPLRFFQRVQTPRLIRLRGDATFDFAGGYNQQLMICNAMSFIRENVDTTDFDIIENGLSNLLQLVTDQFNPTAGWFTIRLQTPTPAFIIPRWHRDGKMFHINDDDKSIKFAVCLYGAPTRLLVETPFVTSVAKQSGQEEKRAEWAKLFANCLQHTNSAGQIFAFTCGEHNSPVHSEPNISCYRIFTSVVPGTKEQITQLARLRDLVYIE